MFNLIIATICFSLSFGLIKTQLTSLPSELVVFLRLAIACFCFLPFSNLFINFRIKNLNQTKNTSLKKQYLSMLIGVIQFGVMFLCFIKAFQYLQGNEIAILTTTTPIFVVLWASVFGDKFKPIYIICILFSIIGAGVIIWPNTPFSVMSKGILLMETSNCSFALGQILWKNHINENSGKYMFFAYLGASLFVLPFCYFNNGFYLINSLNLVQILSICYLAIIPTGVGFWLWNKGSIQVNSSLLAIMNNLKIPFAVVFSVLIFQEKINAPALILGSCIMLFAIFLLNHCLKNSKNNE